MFLFSLPRPYRPLLDAHQTEKAIKLIKDFFEKELAAALHLTRVTAPLFVLQGTGVNDDLNGVEQPVTFVATDLPERRLEIVQSLAKWKRIRLADYRVPPGYGIYTDMNAVRPSERLDNLHSLYVDQWDWELVLRPEERNLEFLKSIVRKIYAVIRRTEQHVYEHYPLLVPVLPEEIVFVHAEDLQQRYPHLSPRQREHIFLREHGAAFIIGIGAPLADGLPHDGRAPDYDDWSTETAPGYRGLNGDLLVWNPVLECAFELSSMGIRVDPPALLRQLEMRQALERLSLPFHQSLLRGELPLSIGGGIGQSRLCMYYLRKAHIGEVQVSIWPEEMVQACRAWNIALL